MRTGYLAVVRKEFTHIRREPRMLAFIFMGPLLFLLLFGYALRLQLENVPMAVWNEDPKSVLALTIEDRLSSTGYFRLHRVESEAVLRQELLEGKARAGLHIPPDLSQRLLDGERATIRFYVDGTMPAVAIATKGESGVLGDETTNSALHFDPPDAPPRKLAKPPLIVEQEVLFNPKLRDQDFFLPGVIGILIMQVALVLTSTALVREREYKTFEQLIVTPVSGTGLILGKITPYACIAILDAVLVVSVAHWWFGVPIAGNPALLALLVVLFVAGILSLGMVLSSFAETQQQAMFYAVFVLIPSLLLSGFVFPIEAMPQGLRSLPYILPLTYFVSAVRGIMLKGAGLTVLARDFVSLACFVVLFVALSIRRFHKTL